MVLVNVSLNERMRMPFYDGDTCTRIKIAKLIYTYVSADRSELDDFFLQSIGINLECQRIKSTKSKHQTKPIQLLYRMYLYVNSL